MPHSVLLQAEPGETNLVSVEGSRAVVIRDDGGAPITLAGVPTCMPLEAGAVSCSAVRHIELDLGDGPVHVSVDLAARDGRPGDADRIRRDVESVLGSQFGDVLAGSYRTVQLAGLDGDDQITGGTGAEVLSGGRGNDRIDARDGAPDTVDCGGQALDRAAVDVDAEASITGCADIGP